MLPFRQLTTLAVASTWLAPCLAQTVQPPFNAFYTAVDLGSPPGVPTNLGGLTIDPAFPNVLLIGGNAAGSSGGIYAVPLTRNAQGNITGFSGPATLVATAPNIDGGLAIENGVMLFSRYRTNALGQVANGASSMTKSVDLTALGVSSSVGAMNIVPAGYPNAGHLKLGSYNASRIYDATLVPDGSGTFDVTNVSQTAQLATSSGPEGILYPPPGSPQLNDYSHVVISEYSAGAIAIYDIDAGADPIPATRQPFITGLTGVEGANLDPVTNDFMFSTYGGGNRVIVVRGFGSCGSLTGYGVGTPGTGGAIPSISGTGCPLTGNTIRIAITGARPNTLGSLNIGDQQLNIPVFNIRQLTNPLIPVPHFTDSGGSYTFVETIPNTGAYAGFTFYFQAGYLDPGAQVGISATAGVQMDIR